MTSKKPSVLYRGDASVQRPQRAQRPLHTLEHDDWHAGRRKGSQPRSQPSSHRTSHMPTSPLDWQSETQRSSVYWPTTSSAGRGAQTDSTQLEAPHGKDQRKSFLYTVQMFKSYTVTWAGISGISDIAYRISDIALLLRYSRALSWGLCYFLCMCYHLEQLWKSHNVSSFYADNIQYMQLNLSFKPRQVFTITRLLTGQ